MNSKRKRRRRLGTVLVLTAVMMVAMFALLAMAVDIGYVTLIRTELQSAADSAALAAAWELYDSRKPSSNLSPQDAQDAAMDSAQLYARKNPVGQVEPQLAAADVTIGRLDPALGGNASMTHLDQANYNAVRVRVRRTADINGEAPTFFMRVLGVDSAAGAAEATAMFVDKFRGFAMPPPGKGNLNVMPFALDEQTWLDVLNGNAPDNWSWNEQTEELTPGTDDLPEANLFPQSTGSPGNRGTVDIGARNNSTADVARQIVDGISQADLDHIGGKLELGSDGTLILNGDTGISAGMKDELASIRGQPRIICLYDSVSGPGNRAMYTIIGFAGVRIMDVKLTGKMSRKRVIIQPARVQVYGGIPASDDAETSIHGIYSPVHLVR